MPGLSAQTEDRAARPAAFEPEVAVDGPVVSDRFVPAPADFVENGGPVVPDEAQAEEVEGTRPAAEMLDDADAAALREALAASAPPGAVEQEPVLDELDTPPVAEYAVGGDVVTVLAQRWPAETQVFIEEVEPVAGSGTQGRVGDVEFLLVEPPAAGVSDFVQVLAVRGDLFVNFISSAQASELGVGPEPALRAADLQGWGTEALELLAAD